MSKMKLGVVGTSWITESFLTAVGYFPTVELNAVMSPRQENVDRFMEKYKFAKGYTDFDKLISESEIDILYIASPNSFHFLQTMKALAAKIHVICEKPITLSLAELNELERVAKENDVYFIEAMRPVHHPHIELVKEAIKQLDGLHYANLKFMRYSSKYDAYKNGEQPRVFSKEFGGGALNDLGVYPITLAVLLFGKPDNVMVNSLILESGVDAVTTASLDYGTFICDITFSKVSNTYTYNEIQGEKKALLLSHVTHLDELILVDDNKREVLFNNHIKDDMRFELESFLNIINNKDSKLYQDYLAITKDVTEICDIIRERISKMEYGNNAEIYNDI